MKIDILTLFPDMFKGPFDNSIVKRAREKNLVEIKIHDLRNWATDSHRTVDDKPFGGGVGMILKVDVIDRAVRELKNLRNEELENSKEQFNGSKSNTIVILLDAGGKKFTQKDAKRLSKRKHLILIAGHYEGIDYRVHQKIADKVFSIGDYILTGGELPAMVLTDAIVRLVPGVLEKSEATLSESFSAIANDQSPRTALEYPQYTRPEVYKGWKVPKVLLSGNHKEIEKWKREQALKRTKQNRPDLLKVV